MKKVRAVLRLLVVLFYTIWMIIAISVRSLFRGTDMAYSIRRRQLYVHHLFPIMGVRLKQMGTPPNYPCLLVANHRSYLDPALLARDTLFFAVAKAEVEQWPVLGYAIKITGTAFIQRESKTSRGYTLKAIAEKLQAGFSVLLFPEGTTHGDPGTGEFRLGGFKLAAEEHIPIVPVALEYRHREDFWVGNDSFIGHFLNRFGEPRMDAYVVYGPPLRNDDPHELLRQAKNWIDGELTNIQKSF
jgi:1-acyl-sn-glycerol-3-phosphate acyltransferase